MIKFLCQCNHLTTEFKELRPEILSSSTFALLKKIFPKDYMEKVKNTINDVTATAEQKITRIKKFLEQKTSALMAIDSLKGF